MKHCVLQTKCSLYRDYAVSWMTQGSIPGRGKRFSLSQNDDTGYGAHHASCSVDTGCTFRGVKVATACCRPLVCFECWGHERVELYLSFSQTPSRHTQGQLDLLFLVV